MSEDFLLGSANHRADGGKTLSETKTKEGKRPIKFQRKLKTEES